MIKIKNLIYILQNIKIKLNLKINKCEQVVILGPNGAGKSTLLNLIAGFYYPQYGEIWLNQQNYTYLSPSKRPVSILFQENNLFEHLTVWQNIALGISSNLHPNKIQCNLIQEIIKKVFLDDYIFSLPVEISGGQRQRTALARCLIRQKPILLLDEPFISLDPLLHEKMLFLIKQTCQQYKITLLIVLHNLEDAVKLATRSIVMSNGSIVYDGELNNLMTKSTSVSMLLGI